MINDTFGEIEKITPRLTILRDSNGRLHYYPNGSIEHVENAQRGWSAIKLAIPIDYDADSEKVMEVLQEVCDGLRKDTEFAELIRDINVSGIQDFSEYAVLYRVAIETKAGEQFFIGREYRRRIKQRLHEIGIKMPRQADIGDVTKALLGALQNKERV